MMIQDSDDSTRIGSPAGTVRVTHFPARGPAHMARPTVTGKLLRSESLDTARHGGLGLRVGTRDKELNLSQSV